VAPVEPGPVRSGDGDAVLDQCDAGCGPGGGFGKATQRLGRHPPTQGDTSTIDIDGDDSDFAGRARARGTVNSLHEEGGIEQRPHLDLVDHMVGTGVTPDLVQHRLALELPSPAGRTQ